MLLTKRDQKNLRMMQRPGPAERQKIAPKPCSKPCSSINNNGYFNDCLSFKSENSNEFTMPENKKMLIIIATHSNTEIKQTTIQNNLSFLLQVQGADIIVVNSSGTLPVGHPLFDFYIKNNIRYIEAPNEKTLDFGKWDYVLDLDEYCKYDYYVFTNDSIIIHSSILHFFHLFLKSNKDLYGYNDSSEYKYHYQSYLFGLKREAIPKLICLFNNKKNLIQCANDVIQQMELNLASCFESKDCFLKISNIENNVGKNIFFKNDHLLQFLREQQLLPFTKIKRVLGHK